MTMTRTRSTITTSTTITTTTTTTAAALTTLSGKRCLTGKWWKMHFVRLDFLWVSEDTSGQQFLGVIQWVASPCHAVFLSSRVLTWHLATFYGFHMVSRGVGATCWAGCFFDMPATLKMVIRIILPPIWSLLHHFPGKPCIWRMLTESSRRNDVLGSSFSLGQPQGRSP